MAVDEGWELTASTPAIAGIDANGRLVARGVMVFTCPECDTVYELEVELPLGRSGDGEFDG